MALSLALGPVGCESLADCARDDFVQEFQCPKERVNVRPRNDVDVYTLVHGTSKPPADVARDPERLAVWQRQLDERRSHNYGDLFEVTGCGHDKFYTCSRSTGASHGATSSLCSGYAAPPATSSGGSR